MSSSSSKKGQGLGSCGHIKSAKDDHSSCLACTGCSISSPCSVCSLWSADLWKKFSKRRTYKARKQAKASRAASVASARDTSPSQLSFLDEIFTRGGEQRSSGDAPCRDPEDPSTSQTTSIGKSARKSRKDFPAPHSRSPSGVRSDRSYRSVASESSSGLSHHHSPSGERSLTTDHRPFESSVDAFTGHRPTSPSFDGGLGQLPPATFLIF